MNISLENSGNSMTLPEGDYTMILKNIQIRDNLVLHYHDLPHPNNAYVLLNYGTPKKSWKWIGKDGFEKNVSKDEPNNCIVYQYQGRNKI